VSLEITTDRGSERFRNLVSRAFVEVLGHELQYGPWTVMLRSEREMLCVVLTGPGDTREEWAFHLGHSRARGSAQMAAQLRQRFTAARASRS
jgi:hypothetical protein